MIEITTRRSLQALPESICRNIFPDGSFLLTRNQSAFRPTGELALVCGRHHRILEVNSGAADIAEELKRVAATCDRCIEEEAAKIPPTRWPEGAEL